MRAAGRLVRTALTAPMKPPACVATSLRLVQFTWAVLPGRSSPALSGFKNYPSAPLHMGTRSFRQEARPGVLRFFNGVRFGQIWPRPRLPVEGGAGAISERSE